MTNTQRYLVLSYTHAYTVRFAVPVSPHESDSQTLHSALAYVDPGESYTVKFTNRRPANVEWLWTV